MLPRCQSMKKTENTAPKTSAIDISIARLLPELAVELELAGALPVAVPLTLPDAVELAPVALDVGMLKYALAFVLETLA